MLFATNPFWQRFKSITCTEIPEFTSFHLPPTPSPHRRQTTRQQTILRRRQNDSNERLPQIVTGEGDGLLNFLT